MALYIHISCKHLKRNVYKDVNNIFFKKKHFLWFVVLRKLASSGVG